MYGEDIDLSYRIQKKGYKNYYLADTSIIHFKGESTIKDGTYMKRFQEAMNFFYKKHFKISVFFSLFMKIGIIFFSVVKMFQGKPKAQKLPSAYILVSDNESIREKLEQKLQKTIQRVPSENGKIVFSQSFSEQQNAEVILDTNDLDFKEAIAFLETHKQKSITFKLLPIQSNFIIGSNSSNDRGDVILI